MPELEIENWINRNCNIEAVKVKPDNVEAIAKWTGGELIGVGIDRFIKIQTVQISKRPGSRPLPTKATAGDWVLKDKQGFKVYRDGAFTKTFTQVVPATVKRDAVFDLVRQAMIEQDALTYHGDSMNSDEAANRITDKIVALF